MQIKLYTQKSGIPNSLIPWVSELESLGIRSKKLNELNDVYEVKNLVEISNKPYFKNTSLVFKEGRNNFVSILLGSALSMDTIMSKELWSMRPKRRKPYLKLRECLPACMQIHAYEACRI
ncbi:MAG: hypothetical protein ACR2KF_06035 [Nitrososphaeraceae archaeon]